MVFFDDPPDYPDDPIESFRITEPIVNDPYWYGNEVVYEDAYGELHSYTLDEWKEILLLDAESLIYFFGDDNIGIIKDLEAGGFWDAEDWEEWRDAYASVHGV